MQVPLGVILKNEANLGDMCHIVSSLSQYVLKEDSGNSNGNSDGPRVAPLIPVWFYGDQLTVERTWGAMVL